MYCWIVGLCLLALTGGALGAEESSYLDSSSGQYQAIFGVLLFIGLIALVALCTGGDVDVAEPVPQWVHSITPDPSLDTGFMGCSDGFNIINNNVVHRHRRGNFETDGAKWGAPLNKGKHVFEIYWPQAMRSTHAQVGVGTSDAPLFVKPKDSLVGNNRHSWGLDIARRRVLHNNTMLVNMPKGGMVPDKFYMYVDCDSCTVGYGTDMLYYGAPIRFGKDKLPVFAMVGSMSFNAQITMIYRGSENRNAMPGNIQTVVVPSNGPHGTQVTVVNPGTVQMMHSQPPPVLPPAYEEKPGGSDPNQEAEVLPPKQ